MSLRCMESTMTDEPSRYDTIAYRDSRMRCALCYDEGLSPYNPLEVHHIMGRFKGKNCDDHRNLLTCCRNCHTRYHSGGSFSLSLGHMLTAKREEDGDGGRDGLDIEFLASLRNRKGLKEDPLPLPEFILNERQDNWGWWSQE